MPAISGAVFEYSLIVSVHPVIEQVAFFQQNPPYGILIPFFYAGINHCVSHMACLHSQIPDCGCAFPLILYIYAGA